MLIHIVADYGPGDLAFAEVIQKFASLVPEVQLVPTPVAPFATLAAGFCVAQLGLNPAPPGTVIFHNVAPREDDEAERQANAGERLAMARLPNGVLVVGVNAGYVYSFLRDVAEELCWVNCAAEGSQFRSRDLFPQAVADLIANRAGLIAEPLQPGDVPDVPAGRVAYADGYGNLKLTLTRDDIKGEPGQTLKVAVAGVEHDAVLSDGSFGVPPGTVALAPGSSGWDRPGGGGRVTWLELFHRGESAARTFNGPPSGAEVRVGRGS